ncbi:MAG: 3-deoxy-8-phosphooctulonate synthase [Haliscomenobacter sp.]|nr:3-deoxy-8-phosphooctulonate synthase [Haliscomenobacter sp.]
MFYDFKKAFPGAKLTTDVHESFQVRELVELVDCIQIPAFLCRQTDLITECAKYFQTINIKKGQWISPENIIHSVSKIKQINPNANVWLTERGTQFGYSKLLVDFGSLSLLCKSFDRVILDCTHSTQYVTNEGFTVGDSILAEKYFLASSIFGYHGVFAEVHIDPENAISDSTCQIHLNRIEHLIEKYDAIYASL